MRDKLFTGFAIAFAGLIVLVGYRTLDLYWQIRALRSRIETVRSARGPADFHTVLLDESWYEVSDSAEPDEPNCAERILLFALTEECTNCLGALKWIAVDVMREPPACTEAWILAVDGIAGRAVDAAGAMLAGTGVAYRLMLVRDREAFALETGIRSVPAVALARAPESLIALIYGVPEADQARELRSRLIAASDVKYDRPFVALGHRAAASPIGAGQQ